MVKNPQVFLKHIRDYCDTVGEIVDGKTMIALLLVSRIAKLGKPRQGQKHPTIVEHRS